MNYKKAIEKLIEHQSELLGPVAERQANKIDGIQTKNSKVKSIDIKNSEALEKVLNSYRDLVGDKAIEAAKRETRKDLDDVPPELED